MAGLQLPLAVLLIRTALQLRVQIGPTQYRSGPAGIAMVMSGIILIGTSLVLFMRSPFRRPLGERLFRLVWMGPIGRVFLRVAARGTAPAALSAGRTLPAAAVTTPAPPATGESASAAPASTLEARVAALERWRDATDSARHP